MKVTVFDRLARRLAFRRRKSEIIPNLVLRAATEADAEAILRLRKQVDKNRNPPLDPYGGEYPTVKQQSQEIREFGQEGLFLVVEVEREIVGIAFAFEMRRTTGEYRFKVVVSLNWRGRGIGTALVSHAIKWARGNRRVNLIVCAFHKSHRDAKHLLGKFGFTAHKQGWAWYMHGARYNEVEMILYVEHS